MGQESKKTVWIEIDGRKKLVNKIDYVRAKTKSLQQFGYPSLTEKDVSEGLEKAIKGEANEIISMFIESDLLKK